MRNTETDVVGHGTIGSRWKDHFVEGLLKIGGLANFPVAVGNLMKVGMIILMEGGGSDACLYYGNLVNLSLKVNNKARRFSLITINIADITLKLRRTGCSTLLISYFNSKKQRKSVFWLKTTLNLKTGVFYFTNFVFQ